MKNPAIMLGFFALIGREGGQRRVQPSGSTALSFAASAR